MVICGIISYNTTTMSRQQCNRVEQELRKRNNPEYIQVLEAEREVSKITDRALAFRAMLSGNFDYKLSYLS